MVLHGLAGLAHQSGETGHPIHQERIVTTEDGVRFSAMVDRHTHDRLSRHMPWGWKAQLVRILLEKTADLLDETGGAGLGLLMSGQVELRVIKEQVDVKAG